jgi:hypothetical protein
MRETGAMKLKLEPKTIAGLALPDGRIDYVFWDAELSGFGLRLRAGGRRVWIAQYRVNGRSRRATLGPVAKLTPIEARQAARRILATATLGGDPQGDKAAKRQRATHTFRSVVDAYLDARQSGLRPVSFRITKLYLTGSYFQSLHPLAIAAITRSDIASCVQTIVRKHSPPPPRRHGGRCLRSSLGRSLTGGWGTPPTPLMARLGRKILSRVIACSMMLSWLRSGRLAAATTMPAGLFGF